MGPSRTITRTVERRKRGGACPFLFLALRCDRPADPGARFSLAGVDRTLVGRAASLCAQREDGGRTLRIGVPDPSMSATHFTLEGVLGSFVAADEGSKNGTRVDGASIGRQQLPDGALIEAGHSFFVFREALQAAGDLLGAGAGAPGLATLLPDFASELERLRKVARSQIPVLLRGESGTGKELLAQAVHQLSGRSGPFVAVNCGAIAPGVLESELFGHRRGAFSGAIDEQAGLVRAADKGTLLLDTVGDLPPPAQGALLRVLQEGEVVPVGAARPVKVDLRVVAATHRDLDALSAQEKFRPDLLARLSGYAITLPLLRERREDLSLIVSAILARVGASEVTFSAEAGRALLGYGWPLNVRELEKCLSAAVIVSGDGRVERQHLAPAVLETRASSSRLATDGRARELEALLREHEGNVTAVARTLGKARTQVQRWLHRYRLDPRTFR